MYKIMLVEDDMQLSKLMQEYLERYGYVVFQPNNFMEMEEAFKRNKPDLVLLDINLPYKDGFSLSRSFRKYSNVPIIIISARSQDSDQIMAIELGADDYITKPFTFELLQSKIKAAIRRTYGEYSTTETKTETKNIMYAGELCMDGRTFTLSNRDQTVELSKNEYRLMKKLMDHQDAFVSREELIEEVWDMVTFVDDNTLTVNISRIRHILSELGFDDIIKSKRGAGYMFCCPLTSGNSHA